MRGPSGGRLGFRNEALAQALEAAIQGSPRSLYSELARHSGLPGVRANMGIVRAFAEECALRGAPSDRLVVTMAATDADAAPGNTELEILPMCGVMALGARAARDRAAVDRALLGLHAAADDLRYRVRDCVVLALARIGESLGDALLDRVRTWMDGYFHAAAVLRALADPAWLSHVSRAELAVARVHEAWELAATAERSAARYPGRKALVEALGETPAAVAARFGVVVLDAMVPWCETHDPDLRDAIGRNVESPKLSRFFGDVERLRKALERSAPVRRDRDRVVEGTRNRGKRARRR
jgi:hypothetical protein